VLLAGMLLIAIAVGDVVDEIDDPSQRAKDRERGQRRDNGRAIGELAAEDQAREDKGILRPLAGSH